MQKEYTDSFMQSNRGCYSREQMEETVLKGRKLINYEDFLDCDIPIKDKYWFFCKKVFSFKENQLIAISCAEIVLPIYENKYKNNKAPREAIEAAKSYLKGDITLDELLLAKRAADAAAVYTADAVAAYAAAVAAYAAAADAAYKEKLLSNLKSFIENN